MFSGRKRKVGWGGSRKLDLLKRGLYERNSTMLSWTSQLGGKRWLEAGGQAGFHGQVPKGSPSGRKPQVSSTALFNALPKLFCFRDRTGYLNFTACHPLNV